MAEWRVGGKVKRTLYRDEQLVGLVDTAEIASEIVETMNRVGRLLDEVFAQASNEQIDESSVNQDQPPACPLYEKRSTNLDG